jgi:hypothetical protein
MAEQRDSPLSVQRVEEVFAACLAHGAVSHPTCTVVGIVSTAHLSLNRLAEHRRDIAGMLEQLPKAFKAREAGGDGGWSFLSACMDRDGRQWTGEHRTMEKLFLLGLATEQASWCLPRDMWEVLPGAMPYIKVTPDTEVNPRICQRDTPLGDN